MNHCLLLGGRTNSFVFRNHLFTIFKNAVRPLSTQEASGQRHVILSRSLEYVPQFGWSLEALQNGARAAGLPPIAHGLFPGGGADLIEYFETTCNCQLNEHLKEMTTADKDQQPVKGGPMIQNAVETRLRMLMPYIEKWPEALAIKSYPSNIYSSLERLANMLDDIWHYAGDRSTDFNWYTKRGILAAVYCSTELYMTQDNSVDFQDTWSFMARRFEDTKRITISRYQFDELMSESLSLSLNAATTIQNMLGLNSRKR